MTTTRLRGALPASRATSRRGFARRNLLLLGLFALLFLTGCTESEYQWGWFAVSPTTETGRLNLRFLIEGFIPTITISFVSLAASIFLGLIISLLGMSHIRILKQINRVWVEVFRSVPVLVMLLWTYYGLPISTGINLDIFAAGVVALALCDSAFEAEIFRAGFQSIPKSQYEAAHTMGANNFQMMRYVILPQAMRNILPPLGNQYAYMLKVSSLVSVIGLGELTRKANELTVIEYRPLEIYTVLILEYLVLILIVSHLVRRLEKKLAENQQD